MRGAVPFLNLAAQYEALRSELEEALERVIHSHQFVLGPEVEAFEEECAAYLGLPHAVAVSSGTDALLMALMALGIGPGDEVIVPVWTFFATAGVVARLGARPVFADVEPVGFGLRPDEVERPLTPRTKAVIVVHLYGQIAPETEPIAELCRQRGIALIEDAAQAFGAQYRGGAGIGSFGLCACVSFYPTKNLGAWGDAGMVVTRDEAFARLLRLLRNHGAEHRYVHRFLGGNFRMDALQAAVLRVKLRRLSSWNARRRMHAQRYAELFRHCGLSQELGATEFTEGNRVLLPAELYAGQADVPHVYHQYVIRVQHRDALRQYLSACGIGTEVYYPLPLHLQPVFAPLGYGTGDFPVAERLAAEVLALPIYPELTPEQQETVVGAIAEFIRGSDGPGA